MIDCQPMAMPPACMNWSTPSAKPTTRPGPTPQRTAKSRMGSMPKSMAPPSYISQNLSRLSTKAAASRMPPSHSIRTVR